MAKHFSLQEWSKIHALLKRDGTRKFGLPTRRDDSVVIGSFNIRKLGTRDKKSDGAFDLLARICERFDLLAIQEIQDDLSGLRRLVDSLRPKSKFGLAVSDITGTYPGQRPAPERLAFLFRWDRISRTEVASDISFDRGKVVSTLYEQRNAFRTAFDDYTAKLAAWETKKAARKAAGKRAPTKPVVRLPDFVTFIRQPLCVSFQIPGGRRTEPIEFLAVNAHLLYGRYKDERRFEFEALVEWLVDRAATSSKMYHPNIILLGDCNLDVPSKSALEEADAYLKSLNDTRLKGKRAKLNFPFLSRHPVYDQVLRSNARLSQTYDQIGFVSRDKRLPRSAANETVRNADGAYYYDLFNFVELFSEALHERPFGSLTKLQKKKLLKKFEHDFSDHMPIWVRLPKP